MGKHHTNQHLAGVDFASMTHDDCVESMCELLQQRVHGFCFSPYLDGQGPRTEIGAAQIEQRLRIIQPFTRWIRTFSCNEGHQLTPAIAHDMGLKTMVGVSIGDELDKNRIEMDNAIALARRGEADILAVGNEVLLRGDISLQAMLEYINEARQALPDQVIGYVDAYFLFEQHPELVEACDVLLINCYPYWEDCPVDHALLYVKEMLRRAQSVSHGKPVIISETGWPSAGDAKGATVPSLDNMMHYFINITTWAQQEGIEVFYFSSFDEAWKTGDEGDVGAYWGLWDKDGRFKFE